MKSIETSGGDIRIRLVALPNGRRWASVPTEVVWAAVAGVEPDASGWILGQAFYVRGGACADMSQSRCVEVSAKRGEVFVSSDSETETWSHWIPIRVVRAAMVDAGVA